MQELTTRLESDNVFIFSVSLATGSTWSVWPGRNLVELARDRAGGRPRAPEIERRRRHRICDAEASPDSEAFLLQLLQNRFKDPLRSVDVERL